MIHNIQIHLLWPLQIYHNMVLKIGKAAGGERAIGLTRGLYRNMGRAMRGTVLTWSKSKAGFWDNAISGSSGLQAAIRRVAFAEIKVGAGWHVGSIFGDYKAFYENLDWVLLMELAMSRDYPLAPLVLGLQLHMAPRTLHVGGAVSDAIFPSNGFLAGCWQATEFARIMLYGLLDHMQLNYRPLEIGEVVDDVVLGKAAPTEKGLIDQLTDMAVTFHELSEQHKFPFSPGKVKIVASTLRIANQVQERLEAKGITIFKAARAVKDLGVDHGGGKSRSVVVRDARVQKAKGTFGKATQLAKVDSRAMKLGTTGAIPQAFYGASAYGIPAAILKGLRLDMATTCGVSTRHGCTTVQIVLGMGPTKEPHFVYLKQLMADFYTLWNNNPDLREGINRQWMRARIQSHSRPAALWQRTQGIIGATVASLRDVGWDPVSPLTLINTEGAKWLLQPEILAGSGHIHRKLAPLTDDLFNTLEKHHWAMASKGFAGRGLEGGVDIRPLRRLQVWLHKQGHHGHLAMLRTIHAGAFWSPFSLHLAYGGDCPCPHGCGLLNPPDIHIFWTCEKIQHIDHPFVQRSQRLVERAKVGGVETPSLWVRGLVPAKLTQPQQGVVDQVLHFGRPHLQAVHFYCDASGGQFSSDPRMRRITWICPGQKVQPARSGLV